MELKIVNFIKNHSNWEELLTSSPYNLTIKRDGKLILFKYNQINSDFSQEICCEARGLILEEETWKVVRMAFKKFFNIGETYAAKIDWNFAVATEKIDGSIISVFYYDGKWRIATNSTIDAFKAELDGVAPFKTFGELFESVLPLSTFIGNRYENLCFTFELVSPYNKVVIDYPETKVYLLSVRYMHTLNEVEPVTIPAWAKALGVEYPEFYYTNDEAGFRKIVDQMGDEHEGIVVRDAAGKRVKIKTMIYFFLHHAKNNGVITMERVVNLIRENDYEEFLSYFPEYADMFDKVREKLHRADAIVDTIKLAVDRWKEQYPNASRKDFAITFKDSPYPALYFAAYDERLETILKNMNTKQFIKFFNLEEE